MRQSLHPFPCSNKEPDSATWRRIAVGTKVQIEARVQGIAVPLMFAGQGPARAGELAILEGRTTVGPPIATVRLVDERGQAIADEEVGIVETRFLGDRIGYGCGYRTERTDSLGRLKLAFGKHPPETLHLQRGRKQDEQGQLDAVCVNLVSLKSGPNELGDIELSRPPICAKGRLVDRTDQPVAGVWLTGRISVMNRELGAGSGSDRLHEHRVQTDSDGGFTLREAEPADTPIRLTIEGSQQKDSVWSTGSITVRSGERDKTYTAYRAATIECEFVGDLDGMGVDITLTHRESGEEMRTKLRDGKLKLRQQRAGTYDIKFGRRHGFVLRDITVTNQDGKALPGVFVWCIEKTPDGKRKGGGAAATDSAGRARFLAPRCNRQVEIKPDGYAPVVLTKNDLRRNVVLERISPIPILIEGIPKLPAEIHAVLAFSGGNNPRVIDGKAVIRPDTLGTIDVALRLLPSNLSPKATELQTKLRAALRGAPIRWQLKATSAPPRKRQALSLTPEQIEDLKLQLEDAKAAIRDHNNH